MSTETDWLAPEPYTSMYHDTEGNLVTREGLTQGYHFLDWRHNAPFYAWHRHAPDGYHANRKGFAYREDGRQCYRTESQQFIFTLIGMKEA
jgi:hypothetical protein